MHAELDLYSASSLKQQFADRPVAPFGHPIYFLLVFCFYKFLYKDFTSEFMRCDNHYNCGKLAFVSSLYKMIVMYESE